MYDYHSGMAIMPFIFAALAIVFVCFLAFIIIATPFDVIIRIGQKRYGTENKTLHIASKVLDVYSVITGVFSTILGLIILILGFVFILG